MLGSSTEPGLGRRCTFNGLLPKGVGGQVLFLTARLTKLVQQPMNVSQAILGIFPWSLFPYVVGREEKNTIGPL